MVANLNLNITFSAKLLIEKAVKTEEITDFLILTSISEFTRNPEHRTVG